MGILIDTVASAGVYTTGPRLHGAWVNWIFPFPNSKLARRHGQPEKTVMDLPHPMFTLQCLLASHTDIRARTFFLVTKITT